MPTSLARSLLPLLFPPKSDVSHSLRRSGMPPRPPISCRGPRKAQERLLERFNSWKACVATLISAQPAERSMPCESCFSRSSALDDVLARPLGEVADKRAGTELLSYCVRRFSTCNKYFLLWAGMCASAWFAGGPVRQTRLGQRGFRKVLGLESRWRQ